MNLRISNMPSKQCAMPFFCKDKAFLSIVMGTLLPVAWHCIYELPITNAIQPDIVQKLNLTSIDNGLKDFQLSLQKEEEQIWQEIQQILGITKKQFMTMKNEKSWCKNYDNAIQEFIFSMEISLFL